ncbi:S-adenosyl-L-methionine-dependent methyltransferase [Pelagophyceae sp. CCMP2097]|nr:S-adenosyl-L-methionine-dependent methyltransferase [Pelagophyceae sp. CCMP2097]
MSGLQHDAHFWEALQSDDERPFDWLLSFQDVPFDVWANWLGPKDSRIVVVGCGTASLSAALAQHGWNNLVSTDSSASVIHRCTQEWPMLEWRVCDCRALFCDSGTVDIVLDKACFDALLCYAGDKGAATQAVKEAARVLKPGGKLVSLTCVREAGLDGGLDGFGGGRPKLEALLAGGPWRDFETTEVPNALRRPMAPAVDVIPESYALIVAQRGAAPAYDDAHLIDYHELYTSLATEAHDAFATWAALAPHIQVSGKRVFEVGFGSSAVGAAMIDCGALYVGIDAVEAAVVAQRLRYPNLRLHVGDARRLADANPLIADAFGDAGVDIVFDKGTADSLFLYADADAAIDAYLDGAAALLQDRGEFVVVSTTRERGHFLDGFGAPRLLKHAEALGWRTTWQAEVKSDVGATSTDRTYDVFALRPP